MSEMLARLFLSTWMPPEDATVEMVAEHLHRFAERAWRRPLTQVEKDRLRAFYTNATEKQKLDHGKGAEA